ncbi:MAG: PAS domain S-box protein [Pseudomonadota bacterium]
MKNPFSLPRPIYLPGPLRWILPVVLVLLFLAVLFWLPWQARQMESNERQEQLIADTLWVEQTIRFELTRNEVALADLAASGASDTQRDARLDQLRKNGHELVAARFLDDSADHTPRMRQGHYSNPTADGRMDYRLPIFREGRYRGSLVVTYRLATLLEEMVPWWFAQENQVSLVDTDDKVVARRAAAGEGRGVYTHKHALELPGATLVLATDSVKSAPRLLPNLLVGSVIALAVGLLASLISLWRHIARRLAAEGALRQQMAFRTAMENSLVTGLRARDLEGRVTYVNPAFCQIVGLPEEELVGKAPPMPYWAPEAMADYQRRFAEVLAGTVTPQFETIFQRADGERIPVLIFEAPLVDSKGKHTGWVGSVLDISDRKRAEDLVRQQQEKLQTSARLATMGEISSMLAHELNQPLAAISSYTTGALNILKRDAGVDAALLRPALEQASAQAQRAGQIIRSVHEFVKKREPERQPVAIGQVVDGVAPLLDLQARKYFVAVANRIDAKLPQVMADRILLEQVLLNLCRNGIEAMQHVPPERRILRIEAHAEGTQVVVSVIDQGHGIAPEVAERLFSPFFSTKAEGMGMGLSICRTAIEFHGGTLVQRPNPEGGTIFTFSLPAH